MGHRQKGMGSQVNHITYPAMYRLVHRAQARHPDARPRDDGPNWAACLQYMPANGDQPERIELRYETENGTRHTVMEPTRPECKGQILIEIDDIRSTLARKE